MSSDTNLSKEYHGINLTKLSIRKGKKKPYETVQITTNSNPIKNPIERG
jgi:hypothetical protein